jgi:hypothetical protein
MSNLNKYYHIERKIGKNKLLELEKIYVDGSSFNMSKCAPIYRDILVFKQKDTIVGLSKICFECNLQFTIDKYGVQKDFDSNDFERLELILK